MTSMLPRLLLLCLAAFAAQVGPVAAQRIGAVEEVRAEAFATPPAAGRARVAMARQVVSNEAIETANDAAVGLRFVDQTVFRIGPASLVTLDSFVFDPNATAGTLALNLGRGAFRFISGSMPKEGISVRTPTALIGVRGTDFLVRVAQSGATSVTVFEGSVIIQPLVSLAALLVLPGQRSNVDDAAGTPSIGPAPPDERGQGFLGSEDLNARIAGPRRELTPNFSPPVMTPPPPVFSPPIFQKSVCLGGDTIIETDSGPRRIDAVKPGDWVRSLAEEGGMPWRQVRALQSHSAEELRAQPHIRLIGLRIAGGELRLTEDHLLLSEAGWRRAGDLRPGDLLRAGTGGLVTLQAVRHGLAAEPVYNLDVESFPAYVAGGIFVSG